MAEPAILDGSGAAVAASASAPAPDRPARIRAALRSVVAERGFHGASMQAVAKAAGVAAGTAYVHYDSKDDLVIDAYRELKAQLSEAAVAGVDLVAEPAERFLAIWANVHRFLAAEPERARFLVQVDVSPYAGVAHQAYLDGHPDDRLAAATADLADRFVDLPPLVLFDLAVGPAIRLVAGGDQLDADALDRLASSCWRAVNVD
ncbi:MAG: TetR family transcriptional regulator [Actinomycetota bacterium]